MARSSISLKPNPASKLRILAALTFGLLLTLAFSASAQNPAPGDAASPPSQANGTLQSTNPRGQKLVLKDGSVQVVREYQIDGNRVKYYSLDTHQWEEMPTELIDWDATKKEAANEAKRQAAIVNAVSEREKEENPQVLSVDASIEPAPGIFLPSDNGLFAFDGKRVMAAQQAEMKSNVSKAREIAKILAPVPIVPSRHVISIAGKQAKLRMTNGQPEFYLRVANDAEPEIDLVRAKVKGNERQVEDVDELMGETSEKRKNVALQRWQLAPNVYRYTVAKPLDPGEYVLVQAVANDQFGIYLWDFAIDPAR